MGLIAGVIRDENGDVVASASVYVYTIDTTTPVTLYSDRGLSLTRANPIVTGPAGEYAAYAPDGIYDLHVTASGHSDVDIPDVPVTDPRNYAWLAGKAGGQTLNLDTASGATTGKVSSTAHATKGKWFLNAAGTITVDEGNLRLGIGRSDPQVQSHNYTTGGAVETRTETTNTGAAGVAITASLSASARAALSAYGSGATASLFGITQASYANLASTSGTGFLIGTSHNAPLIMGTQDVRRFEISGAGVGVWNETGADADFRMEGDTDQNLFFLDAGAECIGIGTAAPSEKLDIRNALTVCNIRLESSNTAATSLALKMKRNTTGNVREWWVGVGVVGGKEFSVYDVTGGRVVLTCDDAGFTDCAGVRIGGLDASNTIYKASGALGITTNGSAINIGTAISTTHLGIDANGNWTAPVMHNATGNTVAATQMVTSGTYTPTFSNVANVAASTARVAQWTRVGKVVSVCGEVDVDPTTGSTLAQVGVTLPIASNFASAFQCAGTAVMDPGATPMAAGRVKGDATNDRAQIDYYCEAGAANRTISYSFQYVII